MKTLVSAVDESCLNREKKDEKVGNKLGEKMNSPSHDEAAEDL